MDSSGRSLDAPVERAMTRTLLSLIAVLAFLTASSLAVSGTWIRLTSMPDPRQEVAVAELNGRIYVIGGLPRTNRVQEYDPVNDSWRFVASAPIAVDHPGAASAGGK